MTTPYTDEALAKIEKNVSASSYFYEIDITLIAWVKNLRLVNRSLIQSGENSDKQIAALQRENARLREALVKYGGHDALCERTPLRTCECGYMQALAGGEKET